MEGASTVMCKRAEMLHNDGITSIALSFCRIYLCSKDAFPAPQMKAEREEAVRREVCAKTETVGKSR